jgi:hypothetical protein
VVDASAKKNGPSERPFSLPTFFLAVWKKKVGPPKARRKGIILPIHLVKIRKDFFSKTVDVTFFSPAGEKKVTKENALGCGRAFLHSLMPKESRTRRAGPERFHSEYTQGKKARTPRRV